MYTEHPASTLRCIMTWVRDTNVATKREKVWGANQGKDLYTGTDRSKMEDETGIDAVNKGALEQGCKAYSYNVKGIEVDHALECQQVVRIWADVKDDLRNEMSRTKMKAAADEAEKLIYKAHNDPVVNLNNTTAKMNRAKEFAVMDWLKEYDNSGRGVPMIDSLKNHGVNPTYRRKIVGTVDNSIGKYKRRVEDAEGDAAIMLTSFNSQLDKITGLLGGL
eukprot:760354-Prymnesium_polylepis.2